MIMTVEMIVKTALTKESTSEILPRTLVAPYFPESLAYLFYIIIKMYFMG